jgi:nucleotide-binding universal stress UspA family protein
VVLTIDQREMAVPGTGAHPGGGGSSFRRILVPVSAPDGAYPALAVAARICGMTGGVLRLVHVRTYDPPVRSGRFYLETPGEAAAVLEEALLMAWACGGPRATPAVVDARRGDVAVAIAWQAAGWPADLIVLTRHPKLAITRLVGGSVPDQVMRKACCPVLAVVPGQSGRVRWVVHRRRPAGPPAPPRSPSPLTRGAKEGPATRRPVSWGRVPGAATGQASEEGNGHEQAVGH